MPKSVAKKRAKKSAPPRGERDLYTRAIHAGETIDPSTGAVSPGIHPSATFILPEYGPEYFEAAQLRAPDSPHVYARWSHPDARLLEEKAASVEGGAQAIAFATGMAAISGVFMTFLGAGDHVIGSDICYLAAQGFLGRLLPKFGVEVTTVNASNPEEIALALRPNTKLIYLETPANPLLRLTDLRRAAEIARQAGALLVVDSTWAPPPIQFPLNWGADLVIHSATKYLNGGGDALGGLVIGRDGALIQRLRQEALVHFGGAISPFNAWLIARGLATLAVRMERHSRVAAAVAQFLENHAAVARVYYPGLKSHPQYELAQRQMADGGGMITFELRRGVAAAAYLASRVRIITHAVSLGHPRSLLFYYPTEDYLDALAYLPSPQRQAIREWMGTGLVRLSVGLESADDLIQDLDQALRGTASTAGYRRYRQLKIKHGFAKP
jgi:methionine-gamma-lyase